MGRHIYRVRWGCLSLRIATVMLLLQMLVFLSAAQMTIPSICGVVTVKDCKCHTTDDGIFEMSCPRIGLARLPNVEMAFRTKVNVFRLRGNFIQYLFDSDIRGYNNLDLLDIRSQKHNKHCVVSKLSSEPNFKILGLCKTEVSCGFL